MKKISVIVPVYNIEAYITDCIESVLRQTEKDYELILVDDGSVDGSGGICDAYAEQHTQIKVIHKRNGGLADARNAGVRVSEGEYLLFLDGDDYLAGDTLERLGKITEQAQYDVILSEGMYRVIGGKVHLEQRFHKADIQNVTGEQALKVTIRAGANWSAWGKCFRREFWQGHQFEFDCHRLYGEDMQLIDHVVLKAERVAMISAFYYYRYRENSLVNSVNARFLHDIVAILREWKSFLGQSDLDRGLKEQFYAIHVYEVFSVLMEYVYLTEREERGPVLETVREYRPYFRYSRRMDCRIANCCMRILGVRATCCLMGIVKKCCLKKAEKQRKKQRRADGGKAA